MSMFKNIKSFFSKDSNETIRYTKKCSKINGPTFISLKSDKKLSEMVKKPNLIKLITTNHKKDKQDYLKRMVNKRLNQWLLLKNTFDYWDGSRSYGYGGYKYDGRWKNVAKKLLKNINSIKIQKY